MSEVWKVIPGYEGLYQASNLGRIRSKDRTIAQVSRYGTPIERKLKGRILKLQNGDTTLQVNHKNGIRSDNRSENLEWVTCSENHLHAYREIPRKKHGLTRKVLLINDQQVLQFDSCLDASKFLCVRPGSIASAALRGHKRRGYGAIYAT